MPEPRELQLLIAEDSLIVRERLEALAREYLPAHSICSVATGADALAVFDLSRPDAVLLDLGLPDMSGLEVLEHIRRQSTSTEVIVFTNWASPEMAARCRLLGADHFVSKAHDIGPVIKVLKTITAPSRGRPPAETSPPPGANLALEHRPAASHPISLLVVEDDASQADPLLKLLRLKLPPGSTVTLATSQAHALQSLREGAFEVALLDLGLPDSDGVDAVLALRNASPDLAIIVLSVQHDDRTIEAAVQAGADDYFIKGELAAPAMARAVIAAAKRRRNARALAIALASRQRIMDSSADVICTLDASGRFVEVGAACERLWGYPREELIGRLSAQWTAACGESGSDGFLDAVESGAVTTEFENSFLRKDGSRAAMRWTAVWSETDRLMYCVARDISQRKRNEEMLRATIAAALDCIITIDENNRVLEFNPAAERTFGWTRAEALGQPLTELIIPPAFRAGHAAVMAELLGAGETPLMGRRIEIMAMHSDGSEFPVEWSLVRIGTGKPARFTAFLRGITERVSAREKLEAQEEQYRVLFEGNPNPMWVYDQADLRILAANDAAVAQYGYARAELIGMSLLDLRPAEDREALLQVLSAAGTAARHGGIWRHLRKDGSLMLVDVYWSPMTFEGRAARMAVLVNVTEQKQAEADLRASEERFATAFEFAPLGMAIVNLDGQWLKVNRALCDILGYTQAELTGKNFRDVTHEADRDRDVSILQRLLAGEVRFYHAEKRYLHKAGHDVWVLLGVSVVCDPEGRPLHFVSQIQDISERKRAEEALVRSEGDLRALSERLESERARLAEAQAVAKIGSWELDLPSKVARWSAETFRIFGVTPDDFTPTYKAVLKLVHPEDRAEVTSAFAGCRDGCTIEHRILMPNGESKCVEERWNTICDADGKALRATGTCQDITDRNAAQVALRKDQAFLAALVDNVSEGIVACDEHGVITLSNRATREFHGLPAEAVPAAKWAEYFDIYEPDGRTLLKPERVPLCRALADGSVQDAEMVITPRDGETRRIVASGRAFFDEDGDKIGAVVAMHDVTKAREAEENLRESEAALRLAQHVAHLGSWELDLDNLEDVNSNPLRWSDETFRILGFEPNAIEVTNEAFFEIVHPADRDKLLTGMLDLIGGGTYSVDYRIIRPGGSERLVHEEAALIFGDDPKRPLKAAGTVQDVTDLKASEQRIREQAEMLQLAHDAIVIRRFEDRTITFWNAGAEKLYGWTAGEAIGQRIDHLLFSDQEHYETLAKATEEGGYRGEAHQVAKDGRALVVHAGTTVTRNSDGTPRSVLIIQTDITDHKKLEGQFLRAQRLESIGTLASGVAHDLNNVLAPILMSAPLLRDELPPALKEKIIGTIESSAERGAQIVKQVLTFARGVEGERVLLDPRHLIKEMTEIAEQTFPKSIEITSSVGQDVSLIEGDPTQLHQVLLNLAVNARDAMPTGGKLTLSAENFEVDQHYAAMTPGTSVGSHILINVTDTGEGIPAHVLEKMFDPFFTTKEVGKGTGLGLSTVLGIVKSHHGTVNAYSTPSGTTFRVLLPAAQGMLPLQPAGVPDLPPGTGEIILVVDDEAAIRDVAKVLLERNGYQVLLADDAPSALAVFAQRQSEIALVLTDYLMPIMNGLDLARIMRKMNSEAIMIVSTGRDDDCGAPELEAVGVAAALTKPYTQFTLLQTLHCALHGEGEL